MLGRGLGDGWMKRPRKWAFKNKNKKRKGKGVEKVAKRGERERESASVNCGETHPAGTLVGHLDS